MKTHLGRHQLRADDRSQAARYIRFDAINGNHDFKEAVPEGFVEYQARTRRGGKVMYFNFRLAKEMGLIPKSHPHTMNPALSKKILDTFSLQIINEWDIAHKVQVPKEDIRPHKFMATRYLQLQHPKKNGTTSGDGRSIWNGQVESNGTTWDITSCGTGATRLSPATAIENRFFRTGDPRVCYGCGYADVEEGLSGALMSETFYKNEIRTERVLAIIEFPNKGAINVRAGTNLIRPSHFFGHLKQGNLERLKAVADYYINRQISNGDWKNRASEKERYKMMALEIARTLARVTAKWESDYIFVWLDWDGDNVLANGGIIDYGSVRQFGLYHHEYRYDDVNRWSTTIPEQKMKARYLVQTFAQIRDSLIHKRKKSIKSFSNDKILRVFDREFEFHILKNLLYKVGFNREQRSYLLERRSPLVKRFNKLHSFFEKAKSTRRPYETGDGRTHDAIYCMRDILRELPIHLLKHGRSPTPEEFMKIIASSYANRNDRKITRSKIKKMGEFLGLYLELLKKVQNHFGKKPSNTLLELIMRSAVINRYDRITGDSIGWVTEHVLKEKKRLSIDEVQSIIDDFIECQKLRPSVAQKTLLPTNEIERKAALRVRSKILRLVEELREGL